MMDLASDPPMEVQSSSMQEQKSAAPTFFRLLAVDGRGSLLQVQLRPSNATQDGQKQDIANKKGTSTPQTVTSADTVRMLDEVKGAAATRGDLVVQKIARGRLRKQNVIALARKDGRIDVYCADESAASKAPLKPLITLRNAEMKKGIHRWAGLAVAQDGVFACTSAGDFRFYSIDQEEGSNAAVQQEPVVQRELPEPLQQVTFTPSSDPTHFAYGGEEIPLSVWDARQALLPEPLSSDGHANGHDKNGTNGLNEAHAETSVDDDGTAALPLNGKARKRKRAAENRAKARELLWGEVWRAKNLPNDALSLPQRADIVSVAFVAHSTTKLAVGTRSGLVRTFDTDIQRRHLQEFRVFAQDKSAVKHLTSSFEGRELIACDTTGRVFVLDTQSGAILYQYKGIHGAVVSWDRLSPLVGRTDQSYIATASADRLVRLHSVPVDHSSNESELRKTTKDKGSVLDAQFVRENVTALVWDGEAVHAEEQSEVAESEGEEEEEDADPQDDGMWDAMATVNEGQDAVEQDVEDLTALREARSKRRK